MADAPRESPSPRDAELRLDRARSVLAVAGGLAHELANLLAGISMALDGLAKSAASDADRRLLGALEESTRRATQALRQMLRLARAKEGEPILYQLQHLLGDLQRLAATAFPETPLALFYPPDLWPLAGDPLDAHQLLLGLVIDLADRSGGAGELRIEARNRSYEGAHGPAVEVEATVSGSPAGGLGAGEPSPATRALAERLRGRVEPLPAGGWRLLLPAVAESEPAAIAALLARLREEMGAA